MVADGVDGRFAQDDGLARSGRKAQSVVHNADGRVGHLPIGGILVIPSATWNTPFKLGFGRSFLDPAAVLPVLNNL